MNRIIQKYKKPLIYISLIIVVLIIMIAIGFPLGFLSTDPDGLERVLIDSKGEPWLESLESFWIPILSWIQNDYVAGIIGIVLILVISIIIFNIVKRAQNRKNSTE